MGTPGHMWHPFDLPKVNTGTDLLNFFNDAVRRLKTAPGSIKWDGINVSFKLVTNENGQKEFRMDRGTSEPASVIGMTAEDAYAKWPPGHGMPPAITALLKIFNTALPSIEPELKILGMWDDPTKYFNTEYMPKGGINVIQYDRNILAIHGINQFYEKKAQPWRIEQGIGMDRPGLEKPIDLKTNLPTTDGGTEIAYNEIALNTLIEKVKPIAIKEEFGNYHLVGDETTQLIGDVNFSATLSEEFTVNYGHDEEGNIFSDTKSLGEWLEEAKNPRDAEITLTNGKRVGALSKLIYIEIWKNGTLIVDLLADGEEFWENVQQGVPLEGTDVQKAIDGAIFYHATRVLGNNVLNASTNQSFGNLEDHEGIILRGMAEKPVKITGEFILRSLEGRIGQLLEGALKEQRAVKVYPAEWNVVARRKEREQWIDRFREQFQKEREEAFHEDPLLDWHSETFWDWMNKGKYHKTWPGMETKRTPWGPEDPVQWEFHWARGLEHMPPCDPTTQSCPPAERRPAQEEEIRRDPHYRDIPGHYPLDLSVDRPIPLQEQVEQKRHLALIPGGFKPPHKGHLEMVKFYHTKVGPQGKVIILMGGGGNQPRTINGRPITLQDAMGIWETYLRNDPQIGWPSDQIQFQNVEGVGPIAPIIDYVREQADPETEIIHLGAGTKDTNRWKMMLDDPKNNPRGVEVHVDPAPNEVDIQGNPLSGTNMRAAIENKDFDTFKSYIPDTSLHMAEDIYVKLSGALLMEGKEDNPLPLGIFLGLIEEALNEDIVPGNDYLMFGGSAGGGYDYVKDKANSPRGWNPEALEAANETEEEIEEMSSMAGGSIEGAMTKSPFTGLDVEKENEKETIRSHTLEEELVKEVTDYLLKMIAEQTNAH